MSTDSVGIRQWPTARRCGEAEASVNVSDLDAEIAIEPAADLSSAPISAPLPDAPTKRSLRFTSGDDTDLLSEQERVVTEHLPMVRYLAQRIHERLPQHVEMDDLVSAGVLGLIDAFHRFDPAKNVQFRSYAQFRVTGAILDSLRMLDWSPRALRRKSRAIEDAIHALMTRLGRSPDEAEVAAEMGLDLEAYQQLLGEIKGLEIGALQVQHSEDSDEEKLAYIPGRPEDDPLFICLKSEMRTRLASAIEQLPERERLVMTLYSYEEMTMKEIGLTIGVGESRVSQIRTSAVLHLRAALTQGNLQAQQKTPKAASAHPRSPRANAQLLESVD